MVLLGLTLLCLLTPFGQALLKSGVLVTQILPDFPVRPLEFFTPPPIKEEVFYPSGPGSVRALIYRPNDEGVHSAMVMVLSITPDFEHPALVRFMAGLARSGFVVLVPDPPGLGQGLLSLEDLDHLVSAFEYLEGQPFVQRQKMGYAGFSLGGSLSLIAATDPRIAERVAYVHAFGGYYDAFTLLAAVSTHTMPMEGEWVAWEPHYQMVDFVHGLFLKNLESPQDVAILTELWYGGSMENINQLSTEGQAVYELMENRAPDRAPELIARLPVQMREGLELLSPRHWRDQLQAPIFILHDVKDDYIPVSEARALAANLPQAQYAEVSLFQHILPTSGGDFLASLGEVMKLGGHIYRLLLVAS